MGTKKRVSVCFINGTGDQCNGEITETTENKKAGLYKITNLLNNRVYIGSSNDLSKRRYEHFRLLKAKKHKNCYNINLDAIAPTKGIKLSTFHGQKISHATSGTNNPFFGKKHSIETIKKISDAKRGKKCSPFTEKHRKNLSLSGQGKPKTENQKKLIAIARSKKIKTIDLETQKIDKFNSILEAANFYNIKPYQISKLLNNKIKTIKNMKVKFEYVK